MYSTSRVAPGGPGAGTGRQAGSADPGTMTVVTTDQILFGVGLTFVLAVGSQVLASRLRIPAIIVLLPVGFVAGALTDDINPNAAARAGVRAAGVAGRGVSFSTTRDSG